MWETLGEDQKVSLAFRWLYPNPVRERVSCVACSLTYCDTRRLVNGHLRMEAGGACRMRLFTLFLASNCGLGVVHDDKLFTVRCFGLGDMVLHGGDDDGE